MKRRTGRSTNAAAFSPLNIEQSAGNNGRPFFGGGFFDAWQHPKKGSPGPLPYWQHEQPRRALLFTGITIEQGGHSSPGKASIWRFDGRQVYLFPRTIKSPQRAYLRPSGASVIPY